MNRLERIARKFGTFGRDYGRPGTVPPQIDAALIRSQYKQFLDRAMYGVGEDIQIGQAALMPQCFAQLLPKKKPENWKWDGEKWVKVRLV